MDDVMKKHIFNIAKTCLGLNLQEEESDLNIEGDISDFLQTEKCLTLCAFHLKKEENGKSFIVFSKEPTVVNSDRFIVIYKIQPCVLTKENFSSSTQVLTINGSPTTALYNTLNSVFTPLLLHQQNKRNCNYSNIKKKIANLNEDLRYAILTTNDDSDSSSLSVDKNSLTVIQTLDHEVEYWNNHANLANTVNAKLNSESYRDILKPLVKSFSILEALPLSDVEDVLENAHNVLDDLWRHETPFPKHRIQHLMDLIASEVGGCIEKHFQNTDIWFKDYGIVAELLQQCKNISDHWVSTCKQLTQIFWPNYSLNPWTTKPYLPQNLIDLSQRLNEILNIRTVHRQLIRLLNAAEQKELKTEEMFSPFKDLDLLNTNESENVWLKANKQFEHLLQPAEERVALKLKQQLSSINANTRQLLYEFTRYSELISRPVVKQILQNERRFLLNELQGYIEQLSNQVPNENPIQNTRYDTPQVVNEIVSSRLLETKVAEVQETSQKLLHDFSGYETFIQTVLSLQKDLKQQTIELFDSWTSEITALINNKSLSLQESEPVVHFSSDKLMYVNYSPRLVTLISEVRQLSAMGYKIPSNIEQTCIHAKQFMKFTKILEQIANFHNTIGDRMINSQKPMMLASALNLSRLVQEQKVVCWADVESVGNYVDNLKIAVEKLSSENNLLAAYHYEILDKINQLENVDLIKDYDKWREMSRQMREIMSQVEQKGFKNLHVWKADIDKSLCSILELQYQKSLHTIYMYLPEIYTDLVYHNSQLQFSPEEDVLRTKYQQNLKTFVDIPKNFRGVSDLGTTNIFVDIIVRSNEKLENLVKQTDELFEQLHGVIKHWQSWLSLGTLDKSKLSTWQHWDLHFRASKTFGQEIAKFPSTEEKVGCFIIGLTRLRTDLEFHNRSYWDQLVSTLKDSIAEDVFKLQEYVNASTATLTKQPVTLEEIGEADTIYNTILKQLSEMESTYAEMQQKTQILSSWTREKVDSANRLQGAWERLKHLLDNHQYTIEKQVETVKATLNITSENLIKEIERFSAKWEQMNSRPGSGQLATDSLEQLKAHSEVIKEKQEQWKELNERKEKLMSDYNRYNLKEIEFPSFEHIESDLEKQELLWNLFDDFYLGLEKLTEEEWIVFRKKSFRLEEFLIEWDEKLQKIETSDLITRMLQEIHKYQNVAQNLKYVKGEDFTEKHWMEVFTLLGILPKPIDILKLQDFLNASNALLEHIDSLQIICKKAASEIVVRQSLSELDQWEVQTRFTFTTHVDSHKKEIRLVKDYKNILNKIGDNQSLLQSVKSCADYDSFMERAELWETKLADLDYSISSLNQIQRKWAYLEPIFGGGTLDKEKARFDRLDRDFRHILNFMEKDYRVTSLCRFPNLRSILENIQDQLARCQSSLDNFLAGKRNKFPRFLFLGNDDLLEVVGQSSKEHVIQNHLKKIFSGINNIKLTDDKKSINAMCSSDGEVVHLSKHVNIDRPVEEWLNELVEEMQESLKALLIKCLSEGRDLNPLKYPSQILCLADSITFTEKCEKAITSMSITSLLDNYKNQLDQYRSLEFSRNQTEAVSNAESSLLELKLKALLLDTIHHITVLEELIHTSVTKITDWNWQKQLRFYSNPKGEVIIKMVNAQFDYSYEYLGNAQKLVRTPLTDQCFLTLTQAMYLGMGGNPYGPAGTGKTETVKALGASLGRQVLVFNCDEGIDSASMGRILSGLARSGAWGCFDEFNRLDEATLSAVSMYIQPIQAALKNQQETLKLLDQEIKLNKHCGVFVTLNPASGSYGGRNKLPDNLKQLFRPVIMTHPDHEQIARTLLHCDGFKNANIIGSKLVEIFDMASKLLSKQHHYDWGLRALKTVLNGCGKALKLFPRNGAQLNANLQAEMKIVVNTLKTDTFSKLTYKDSEIFTALIKDVFDEVPDSNCVSDLILKDLEESCQELGFIVNNRQINKCIELYQQLKQRMGVAVVGPAGCGKSTIRKILFRALTKSGKVFRQHTFNPKSMSRNQLLGQIDVDTRQWTDGVLTQCSLQAVSELSDVWTWIVCDGDIDPEWVESLNSVLDDNRLLTLPSGWRIQFGQNVNFLFETHDLSYCSPATISRFGIVFLNEEDLDLNDYVTDIVKKHDDNHVLEDLVRDYLLKGTTWIFKNVELTLQRSKISVVQTALSQIIDSKNKTEFTVNMLNGFGCQMALDFKEAFGQELFEWTNEMAPPMLSCSYYDNKRGVIDNYRTNPNVTLDDISRGLPLILTAQVCEVLQVIEPWVLDKSRENHFLLVGPHGAAKTMILEHIVNQRSNAEIVTIYCSAFVNPKHVIHKILQHCIIVNSNIGKLYKPKKGFLIIHFKGLHLLRNDKWGTNMLIAFLQQLITYKGFFDSSTLEWIVVENVLVVGSLETNHFLTKRFTSIVHVCNIELPEQEDLNIIYVAYLTAIIQDHFHKINWPKAKVVKMISTLIGIYKEVEKSFTSVDHPHYKSSLHDLTKWCNAIVRYKSFLECDFEQSLLEVISCEALRIFGDKLIKDNDLNKLRHIINSFIESQWNKSNILKIVEDHFYVPIEQTSIRFKSNGSLSKLNSNDWTDIVKKGILQYEREGQNLDVILIPELLQLTAHVIKTLSMPKSNIFLVGRSGIGRRTSVKIVSALQSAILSIPSSNEQPQLNNDLKLVIQQSGIEGKQVFLLLEDHILNNTSIMNTVNTLLYSGEVPDLYNLHELETLTAGLKDEASNESFDGSIYEFFIERVQNNLHLIICLEPDNITLHNTFENCPALLHKCSILWKTSWCETTIKNIPSMFVKKSGDINESKIELSDGFYHIYEVISSYNPAPYRFISLMKLYVQIYAEKKNAIVIEQNKLHVGVSKLTEARNAVAELKSQAAEQQKKLAEKQSQANSALDMISNTMTNTNIHKEQMETLKQQTEKENEQLIKRKREIDIELAEVEPLIQQARAAVGNIKPESLSEIRSLRAPPDVIRDILEGVLRLMGIQDTSWNSMKIFLAKRGVKEDIRSFDASRINPENRKTVERLMMTRNDSFDPKSAKRASVAAAPLAAWVKANVKYSQVVEKIRPLEQEQNKLKQNLLNAEQQLGVLSSGLLDVDATVAKLKQQLATYTKEAAEIEIHLNNAQERLAMAESLVEKLNDEYERWQTQLKKLDRELETLPVFSLLASAFITYLSGQSEDKRAFIMEEWKKGIIKDNFNFTIEDFLATERDLLQWQTEGLPVDQLSIQNAIIILKTQIKPLILDPTSAALKWIKTHLKNKQVEVITQNSEKFKTTLELAVRFGKLLIVEEVESICPTLLNILRQNVIHQGERKLIQLNGRLVDLHKDFQLILSSRNENLVLTTDISSVVSVVNFAITHAGLAEQLLSSAVRQENPALEERKRQLLIEREQLQEKLHELQNQLLENLANSTGDILQNKNLVTSLNETKASSSAITAALNESIQVQNKLQKDYDIYKEIAIFGSSLYFSSTEFCKLNLMYLFSVSTFTRLFLKTLATFEDTQSNFESQQRSLIQSLYRFMSRSLFKSDRMKFALHLVHKMLPKQVDEEEWNVFLGNAIVGNKSEILDGLPSWIPEKCLPNIYVIQNKLPELYQKLQLEEATLWKNFMSKDDCEMNFPTTSKITEFQKVIVIQALRSDKLYTALSLCILRLTGLKNLNSDILNLSQILQESVSKEPILLVTTSGNDPSTEIRELAEDKIKTGKYMEISMGEGQEEKAITFLKDSAEQGHWLVLKNLHLVTSWLPLLCQNLQSLQFHDEFRLWLVTECSSSFSSVLSQNSLKIAYETPQGVKNGLQRIYSAWSEKHLEKLNSTSARIFFVLACVHAVLEERRTYIPQGWSKWYEFNDSDFHTAIQLIKNMWNANTNQIQWKYLSEICYNAVYKGRIENLEDLKILKSYFTQYFVDEVLSHRWKPFQMDANLPNTANFQDYMKIIVQLPNRDNPNYFGLPENINRAWEKNISTEIIKQLKDLQITKSVSIKFDRNLWSKSLVPLMNFWKKVNQGHNFIRMSISDSVMHEDPVINFVHVEFRNGVLLAQSIHKCFANLNKITKGIIMPDDKDILITNSLLNLQTPQLWQNIWEGPKDPIKYIKNVMNKIIYLAKWTDEQNVDKFLKQAINLSNFFNPKAFLASHKQHYSRKIKCALDLLELESNWRTPSNEDTITLSGLFIEGALYNNFTLSACDSNTESISNAPNCYIIWKKKEIGGINENILQVPLYHTSAREKLVTHLQVSCDLKEKNKWIQAALAFYLDY